jgi:hypothetical protein
MISADAVWLALALVRSYELLLALFRLVPESGHDAGTVLAASNGHSLELSEFAALADYLARREVPGVRVIRSRLSVGQTKTRGAREQIRQVRAGTAE